MSRAITGGIAVAALTVGGMGLTTSAASAAPRNPWDAIAHCESGGNWSIDTGNGYFGGLQVSAATWAAYGGRGSAASASRAQQIAIGERVVARQGWGAWSTCSANLGLSGHTGAAAFTVAGRATRHPKHRSAAAHRHVSAHHRAESPLDTARGHPAEQHRSAPRHADPHADRHVGRHAAAPAVSGTTYRVRAGDTLQSIASRLEVAGGWRTLADVNAAQVAHPDQIRPGQVLHLPA